MNPAKIRLSATEKELVTNAAWILTKNDILQKTNLLLGEVLRHQLHIIAESAMPLPAEVMLRPPKISKGENYQGLPYLVLDHPRFFEKEDVFAIRTMFYWGNFFSVTLHLGGKYKTRFRETIIHAYPELTDNWFLCVHESPWEYHYGKDNYLPVSSFSSDVFAEKTQKMPFIKLSVPIPLHHWDEAIMLLSQSFQDVLKIITTVRKNGSPG